MRDVTRDPAVEWRGALEVRTANGGLRPSRLPPGVAYQLSQSTRWAGAQTSGVRIAFRTDSSVVRLTGSPTRVTIPDYDPGPAIIDFRVDGALAAREAVGGGTLVVVQPDNPAARETVEGEPAMVVLDGLAPGAKTVEVWLPHGAGFTVNLLEVDDDATLQPSERRRPWIHYGSSISQSAGADGPSDVWPAEAGRLGGLEVTNLGLGGECHIDQFVARYIRDAEADLISLKLGINTFTSLVDRTFTSAVHGFLDTVRDGHSTTPVVVCSPIFCPVAEETVGPLVADVGRFRTTNQPPLDPVPGLLTLREVRSTLEAVVESRRLRGDDNLHYLDGLLLLGEADAHHLPDLVHPDAAGYQKIAERFVPAVMGDNGLVPSLGR